MLKTLKRKFLIAAVITITIVIGVIVGAINVFHFYSTLDNNDKKIKNLEAQVALYQVNVNRLKRENEELLAKLKNNGNSIFSKNDENSLGIGTGSIVSSNGYILSNSHVM